MFIVSFGFKSINRFKPVIEIQIKRKKMPEVNIYNTLEPYKSQKVQYNFGDETLEEIVKKYDKNASTSTCRLAIGEEIFTFWDIPIEACLEYGDSISIFFYPSKRSVVAIIINIIEIIKNNLRFFFRINYRPLFRLQLKDYLLL